MPQQVYDLTAAEVVARRLPELTLSERSEPTEAEAGNLLSQVAAIVNGTIKSIGIDPASIDYTDENDYPFVRRIVEVGLCADILKVAAGGETESSGMFREEFKELLAMMKLTPEVLIDNAGSSPATTPRSHITDRSVVDSGTFNTDGTPPFRADESF